MTEQTKAVAQRPVQVNRVPGSAGRILQRACACGNHQHSQGECETCKKKRVQRSPAHRRAGFTAPPIVQEVLGAPGQALDETTRAWMETRFQHDFSGVRVHTDARAAASARAVDAQAYTVGRQVVFGAGAYAPATTPGRWLLAHELAHVVQQEQGDAGTPDRAALQVEHPTTPAEVEAERTAARVMAGQPVTVDAQPPAGVQRRWSWLGSGIGALGAGAIGAGIGAAVGGGLGALIGLGIGVLVGGIAGGLIGGSGGDETSVEVQEPTGPNDCRLEHHRKIAPAVNQAIDWLDRALGRLATFLATPAAAAAQPVRQALQTHFRATDNRVATHVRDRLAQVRADIDTRNPFTVQCHGDQDTTCSAAGAYVQGGTPTMLVFCPSFFRGSDHWRSETIIHEMAHALVGGSHITDRAYAGDRAYPIISTAEALTNADSYALLAVELATGEGRATGGPRDSQQDCPTAWRRPLEVSMARAQRWNRNAQTATGDRRPAWLARWADLQTQFLGATTPAALDSAKAIYDRMETRFDSSIEIECEPEGGGRCDDGNLTYWFGIWSDFHVCPAWANQPNEDDRTASLLAGLYGYAGDVDDAQRAWQYARLARSLNQRFWAAPTLQEVLGPP